MYVVISDQTELRSSTLLCLRVCLSVRVSVCVLQCVAVCGSVLQFVALCCIVRLSVRVSVCWCVSSCIRVSVPVLQHTATHCNTRNTLQHTATHCTTLQHTAPHCNTLHHTATHMDCIWLSLLSYCCPRFLPLHFFLYMAHSLGVCQLNVYWVNVFCRLLRIHWIDVNSMHPQSIQCIRKRHECIRKRHQSNVSAKVCQFNVSVKEPHISANGPYMSEKASEPYVTATDKKNNRHSCWIKSSIVVRFFCNCGGALSQKSPIVVGLFCQRALTIQEAPN